MAKKEPEQTLEQKEEQLKQYRRTLHINGGQFAAKRKEMVQARKDGLNSAMSVRGQAINALKAKADVKKVPLKEAFDRDTAQAKVDYNTSLQQITLEREEALASVKATRQDAYAGVNKVLATESKPIIDKHKAELEEIEDSFKQEIAAIDKEETKASTALNERIDALAVEIEKATPVKEAA